MKLKRLEIEGFRAFGASAQIDLDANAVILLGVNGSGKTSLFDAVMWSLSGCLPRVEDPGGSVISEFATSDEARVAIDVEFDDGECLSVVRSRARGDDEQARLLVEVNGSVLRAGEAQVELYRRLWPAALSAPEGETSLTRALTRCVYLQQDLVRQFVELDDDSERFQTISELVGVGRVRELQVELDKARRGWSQATNRLDAEAEPERRRLAELDDRLERLSAESAPLSSLFPDWRAWWKSFAETFEDVPAPPAADAPNAVGALDDALKRLAAEHRSDDRRLLEAEALLKELVEDREREQAESLEPLSALLKEAKTATEDAQAALERARKLDREHREHTLRAEEQAAQLSALAELALKHLGERCPVCTQEYDRDQTLAHLRSLINDSTVGPVGTSSVGPDIDSLGKELVNRQRQAQEIEADLARRHTQEQARALANSRRAERIAAMGLASDVSADDVLRELIAAADQRRRSSAELREAGESLALALAKSSEVTRRAELTREREALVLAVEGSAAAVAARRETGELAGRILETLRTSAEQLVQAQLAQIEPLVERVYARVDPHPAFRRVRLSSRFEHSRGRISTSVEDALANVVVKRPGTVLSSSQLNALAVSIFLALNLGVPTLPLASVLLDDPLQSLDDVNLLGLVDLLRRTSQRRQLIVSTHDSRFASLLERKLRPAADTRTIVVELSGWRREGPHVKQREVPADAHPLRLVA